MQVLYMLISITNIKKYNIYEFILDILFLIVKTIYISTSK